MLWYNGEHILKEIWSESIDTGETMSVFSPVDSEEDEYIQVVFNQGESPWSKLGWEAIDEPSLSEEVMSSLFEDFNNVFSNK